MFKSKKAFTFIELIFVIVILGILSIVALPKFSATRDDAYIAQNTAHIVGVITEISTFIITENIIMDDLREMSEILMVLDTQSRVRVDIALKSVDIEIGGELDCLTISVISDATSESLKTSFSSSQNRICTIVAKKIEEKEYKIILRGQSIKY